MKITQYRYTDANFWSSDPSGVHLSGMDGFEIDGPEAWGTDYYTSTIYDHNSSLSNAYSTHLPVNISTTFNTYAWEWATDNTVKLYFNGTLLYTHPATAFNSIEALIPQSPVLGTALWTTGLNAGNEIANGDVKQVDYVRIYQKPGWTGSTSGSWVTPTNWGPDGIPGAGVAAVFNTAAGNRVIALTVDQPAQELVFQTGAVGAITVNGPGRLLLGATTNAAAGNTAVGGININNDVTQSMTVNAMIVAQRKLQFSNFSRTTNFGGTSGVELLLNGGISAAATGTPINFLTTGPIRVNGAISNQIGNIIKGGQGTVYLNASNSFTGVLEIRDGVIQVGADGALGSVASPVTMVPPGAYEQPSLVFGTVNYSQAKPVSILGNGSQNSGYASTSGAIDVAGNGTNASFAGPITLAGDATIASGTSSQGATLSLSGSVAIGASTLTFSGGGLLNLSGQLTGTGVNGEGRVLKAGAGTVTLSANNTPFKGSWLLQSGLLNINSVNALGGGTGGIINFDGGTLRLTGAVITSKGGSFSTNSGTINTNGFDMTASGAFSGAGGFTKSGAGTLTLTGSNTFSGNITVASGSLVVGGTGNMGSSTVSLSPATKLTLATNITSPIPVQTLVIANNGSSLATRTYSGLLDLTDNTILVRATDPDTLRSMVRSWWAGGSRSGQGIGTSAIALGLPNASYAGVAVFPNVTADSTPYYSYFGSASLLPQDIIVRYTYIGDTNIDGRVDGIDLAAALEGYSVGLTGWQNGDIDYDGRVTESDLSLLIASLSTSLPSLGGPSGNETVMGVVPEPTELCLAGAGLLAMGRNRRRVRKVSS